MIRFVVYRSQAGPGLGKDDDGVARFVFVKEDDLKTGLIRPRGNPSFSAEPEGFVEAETLDKARIKFAAGRANAFG